MVSHLVDSDDRSQMTTIKGTLQYLENCMRLAELCQSKTNGGGVIFFLQISDLPLSGMTFMLCPSAFEDTVLDSVNECCST
jgi:hypothetical protein